jgi:hypothetical protein
MNKSLLCGAVLTLLLTACAAGRLGEDGYSSFLVTRPIPVLPNVFITEDSRIVVDQEPIRIKRGEAVTVVWALPASSSYTFVDKTGIAIDRQPDSIKCNRLGSGKTFECRFPAAEPGGERIVYKYAIRVRDRDRDLETLDPSMVRN